MKHLRPGRPRKTDTPKRWDIMLPSSLADTVTLLLTDPVTGAARIGARSALIERLLREWVDGLRRSSAEGGVRSAMIGETVSQNMLDTSSTICNNPHSPTPATED